MDATGEDDLNGAALYILEYEEEHNYIVGSIAKG